MNSKQRRTFPESPMGSVAGAAEPAWGRLGAAGRRGRAGEEERRNFHAKTTAMAKPATAPKEPALC